MTPASQAESSALQSDLAQAWSADQIAACHQWSALEWHQRVVGEEAERDAAMNRVRAIIARGGRVAVVMVRTPLRTVVHEEHRDADGNGLAARNAGEIWD